MYIHSIHTVCARSLYIAFMMTRGKTKESSCNGNYRGNPQYSKESLSYFHFVNKVSTLKKKY